MKSSSYYWGTVIFALLASIACAGSASPAINQPLSTQLSEPATQETTPVLPTDAPLPTRTPNPFPNPVLKIVSDEEVVFDWTTDRCIDANIPDLAARAFRDSSNQVQLILSHPAAYRMVGPDLNTLTIDCDPVSQSAHDADPSHFRDNEWVASLYTEDGQTVYALMHNEYQGHTHAGMCPQADYFPCWFNTVTAAISTDGGDSYAPIADPPGNFVASLPYPYQAGEGPQGLRAPSNIIKGSDGFYYSYLNAAGPRSASQWVCLMRTDDLADPASWRYWDGTGFAGEFLDPYRDSITSPLTHQCAPLDQNDIGHALNDSVTYNTVMGRYVLMGLSADQIEGREVWGIYYAFSDDLIDWTHRKLLLEIPLPWTVANPGSDLSYLYPSLLDPDSTSRSFETTDQTAYLYITRNNFGHGSLDRDLIRYPVQFFGSEGEYQQSQP